MTINNKSFCAVPFVSIMVNTDTTVRYCCMVKGSYNKIKKSDNSVYTCKDNFIKDAWNSQDMRDIRKAMIKGDEIEGCSVCYLQEKSGRTSNRQHSIQEWTYRLGKENLDKRIEQAKNNDGIIDDDIVYLDLRLGNLCNLKCRMCNPWNSSQIAKEHIELNAIDNNYSEVWKKTFGKFPISVLDDQQWFDHDIMWDQVISLIPSLKKVYMTGGEPTLIKNNFKFMESCIKQGRKDILLFFNTNCTNVNKNFLDLIRQFDNININVSVDGIGEVNDYIRYPSKWEKIDENLQKIAQLPNVHLGITPTIQIYNVFDIPNMLNYVQNLKEKFNKEIFIDFLINVHPHHLNINLLPDDLKQEAKNELLNIKPYVKQHHDNMTNNSLEGIIGLLQQNITDDAEEQLSRLKVYTHSLDKNREQTFLSLDSRLHGLFI